jgi:hypothetical protein
VPPSSKGNPLPKVLPHAQASSKMKQTGRNPSTQLGVNSLTKTYQQVKGVNSGSPVASEYG